MTIDVKKIIGEAPEDYFDAVDRMIKAQQEILEAVQIMISVIEFPDYKEENEKRIKQYLDKYCE